MGLATVIIPLLAQPDIWLRQSVFSAVRQTAPCEVIVVASPHTPATNYRTLNELADRHDNLTVLTQPRNTGYARAFNVGIERATTERVGFLLADDWLDAEAVSSCLAHEADIVSTGLWLFAEDGVTKVGARLRSMEEYEQLPTLEQKAAYLKHFLLFRKDRIERIGGVDESVGDVGPDDFDLPWTLLEGGATAVCTPRPCYNYRDHFGQRLSLRSRPEQIRDLEKILDKHRVYGAERRKVLEMHSQWYGTPIHVREAQKIQDRP